MQNNARDIKHIIWIQTAFLGDIVLTTGAIALAHKAISDCKQVMVTTNTGKSALRGHPYLKEIHSFEKKSGGFISQALNIRSALRNAGLCSNNAIILQVHQSFRSSLLAKIIGIQTVTYEQTMLSSFATVSLERVAVFHETVRIALLLEKLGVRREEILKVKPFLPRSETSSVDWHDTISLTDIVVGISPGSTWATKQWSPRHFKTLSEALLRNSRITLVFLGSTIEQKLVEGIIDEINPDLCMKRIINLAGKTNLNDLRFIYPRLSLLVANDSSPIHYASSFDTPIVAIFGATTSSMGFGPLSKNSFVVERSDLSCRPCSAHGPKECPLSHFNCMNELKPKDVYKACEKILKIQASN